MGESHALCGNGMGEVFTDAEKSRDGCFFFELWLVSLMRQNMPKSSARRACTECIERIGDIAHTAVRVCVCVCCSSFVVSDRHGIPV